MSSLTVYHQTSAQLPNKVLTHLEDIAATLADFGVRFERWQAAMPLTPDADQDQLIDAYRAPLDELMAERGLAQVQVVRMDNRQPLPPELRAERLAEHSYDQDEVCLFVAGRGLFSLHVDDYVYALLCEKNDLIVIPAGIKRWFDMGEHPHFVTIRLFNAPQAAAHFTGDAIADAFPGLDD
jgi:1,2-dihydroxy-3-keto-5-methylthiopentene dioxygenase